MEKSVNSRSARRLAVIEMLMCSVFWSTAGIFVKHVPWNPILIAGGRSIFAAMMSALYLVGIRKKKILINKMSLLNGLMLTGTFLCFIAANKLTTAANAIVLQYCAPVFVVIMSWLVLHKPMKKADVLVSVATFCGIGLFFVDQFGDSSIIGNVLAILAGMFFGGMFIVSGEIDEQTRQSGIFLGHVITAVIGILTVPFVGVQITPVSLTIIILLGVVQLGIPYILFGLAAEQCSPLTCSLLGTIEPILNPVWVFLLDGERPGPWALVGAVVVIAAIVIWNIAGQKKE